MRAIYYLASMFLLAWLVLAPSAARADHASHKLVLQISDNDPDKMRSVLDVAANVSRHYSSLGEEVEIQIVAFNGGLHMLREDTSPVKERLHTTALGEDKHINPKSAEGQHSMSECRHPPVW